MLLLSLSLYVSYILLSFYGFLGEITNEYYPGLTQFAAFMRTYSSCSDFAVSCTISNSSSLTRATQHSPLDFEVGETGSVFVNIFGLSIIFYSSVVIYESPIFKSEKRGYLLLFQYTLFNGPGSSPSHPIPRMMKFDYTKTHLVSCDLKNVLLFT